MSNAAEAIQADPALAENASEELTPNQVAAWNVRRLRTGAGMTQEDLAGLMTHQGIAWTVFTVSDAESAFRRGPKGRRFTPDELALLALIFYVTPASLLTPPPDDEIAAGTPIRMRVGDIVMTRESYLSDVLLHPMGVGARGRDGDRGGRIADGHWLP